MKNRHFVTIITIVILLLSSPNLPALLDIEQLVGKEGIIEVKKIDKKALILTKYLERYHSPMQYHAQDFLDAANRYGLDWKLLPAIAGVESTFGKHIPGGYNAYGWGIYGNNSLGFKSWRDGMFTVAKGLRENYVNRGYNDPYQMNRIYASSPLWGAKVTYFMNDLDQFSKRYQLEDQFEDVAVFQTQTAAPSGILAYKDI